MNISIPKCGAFLYWNFQMDLIVQMYGHLERNSVGISAFLSLFLKKALRRLKHQQKCVLSAHAIAR